MSSKKIIDLYNQLAPEYDDLVLKGKDYVAYEKIPKWVVKDLDCKISEANILDLGCGTGLSSIEFFKAGFQVTGIDITPEMIQRAQKLPFQRLFCMSLETDLPFNDKEFDAAVLLGVMEFINDPKALFKEIFRVLKNHGIFGLSIPAKLPRDKEEKLEIFTYDKESIEKVFQSAGFSIKHCEKILGFTSSGEVVEYYGYLLKKDLSFI
ncbi:MAG: methyltransferase domain-containing protein [Parachlamydiales bacterium]|jgi:SAM-dependent methyltransferase